jgi:HAD superfamily hydrolase (TIGR01509 family)
VVRAVVFDFDGVIANSEPLHFRGFHDVLAGQGVILTEAQYYERYLGFNDVAAYEEVAADRGLDWDARRIAALVERKAAIVEALERGPSILFPGARDAVQRLAAACALGIASGALRGDIMRVLEREDLARHFAVVVSADDMPVSKPAPDPYLRAMDLLSAAAGIRLTGSDCAAIEDSPWGLESARTAGLRTVAVTHSIGVSGTRRVRECERDRER